MSIFQDNKASLIISQIAMLSTIITVRLSPDHAALIWSQTSKPPDTFFYVLQLDLRDLTSLVLFCLSFSVVFREYEAGRAATLA